MKYKVTIPKIEVEVEASSTEEAQEIALEDAIQNISIEEIKND